MEGTAKPRPRAPHTWLRHWLNMDISILIRFPDMAYVPGVIILSSSGVCVREFISCFVPVLAGVGVIYRLIASAGVRDGS
jgi:hypothetical protein